LGSQGFAGIKELITELLTTFIARNTTYNTKNTYFKIINIADYNTCKKRLLAVEYPILMNTIIQLERKKHFLKLQMDPLGDPLTTCPIQTSLDIGIEPCWN